MREISWPAEEAHTSPKGLAEAVYLSQLVHNGSGVDWRIILRWIFRKWGYGLDRAGSGKVQVEGGTCE